MVGAVRLFSPPLTFFVVVVCFFFNYYFEVYLNHQLQFYPNLCFSRNHFQRVLVPLSPKGRLGEFRKMKFWFRQGPRKEAEPLRGECM